MSSGVVSLLIALALAAPAKTIESGGCRYLSSPAPAPGVAREVVALVRDRFYDAKAAGAWAQRHGELGAKARSMRELAEQIQAALKELGTSHTEFHSCLEPDYYDLLAIFRDTLKTEVARWGVGADFRRAEAGWVVRHVFPGGPAEAAGLLRGDLVLRADGRPFDPVAVLVSSRPVALELEREKGGRRAATVLPRLEVPAVVWREAQKASTKVFDRGGRKIGYQRVWTCAGEQPLDDLSQALLGPFKAADALVMDLRGGWGGCSPGFLDLFNPYRPDFVELGRGGVAELVDAPWRKPLVLLVDGGSRSGKELVAFAVKRRALGKLVGQRTAGAVMAGRPFLLADDSLLYVAVDDVLLDGERVEGRGVEPDVSVEQPAVFAAGADPQLERALDEAAAASSR